MSVLNRTVVRAFICSSMLEDGRAELQRLPRRLHRLYSSSDFDTFGGIT